MSVIAVYNLKGGVGKTTAAVNLSYLAAVGGARTLLWDLDPQGASSFAFRIQPHVEGFGKKSLERGTLAAAIKATDFESLDLLPADFAYRKLDRLLGDGRKPQRAIADLVAALGRGYENIFLDCPPGFSLLTESVFAAAQLVIVPTIPTVLSLRTLARLLKWTGRNDRAPALMAFLSMVDRRKTLHRRACQWAARHHHVFLASQIPYASIVEQMAVRRLPLPAFAPHDHATAAFDGIWQEIQGRTWGRDDSHCLHTHDAIEALSAELESVSAIACVDRERNTNQFDRGSRGQAQVRFVHGFDTDRGDLRRRGCAIELYERSGTFLIVAAQSSGDSGSDHPAPLHVQIDSRWAMQILAGALSPLTALERRCGHPRPRLVARIHAATNDRPLRRIASSTSGDEHSSEIVHSDVQVQLAAVRR
jgi:cellulose biosynthesis protein BcsQ